MANVFALRYGWFTRLGVSISFCAATQQQPQPTCPLTIIRLSFLVLPFISEVTVAWHIHIIYTGYTHLCMCSVHFIPLIRTHTHNAWCQRKSDRAAANDGIGKMVSGFFRWTYCQCGMWQSETREWERSSKQWKLYLRKDATQKAKVKTQNNHDEAHTHTQTHNP